MVEDPKKHARRLALDPNAESASSDKPAFLTPPPAAPAYYGFPVLEGLEVDGFRLGMITDFDDSPESGDAFVVAPDGSRAGLVWETAPERYFEQVCPPEPKRWGVWAVALPYPMNTEDGRRCNLKSILPQLRQQWQSWQAEFGR